MWIGGDGKGVVTLLEATISYLYIFLTDRE